MVVEKHKCGEYPEKRCSWCITIPALALSNSSTQNHSEICSESITRIRAVESICLVCVHILNAIWSASRVLPKMCFRARNMYENPASTDDEISNISLSYHPSEYVFFPLTGVMSNILSHFFLCALSSFGTLLHTSQSWLRFSDSTEAPNCGLMWAQLYEKQMSIDWKKTFPSSIQAQAHQANRLLSLYQQKKQHVLDLIHLDISVVQFCTVRQQKRRHISAWYFPLCVRHITKQRKIHFSPYRKITSINYQLC